MAKQQTNPVTSTSTRKVGVTGNYQYQHPVNPKQKMFCGRTGINKAYGELTDADIEAMVKAGNNGFTKAEATA